MSIHISRIIIAFVILFIALLLPVVYSRDQLFKLHDRAVSLGQHDRSIVTQLGLRRRGCRAGLRAQRRRRLPVADITSLLAMPGDNAPMFVNNQTNAMHRADPVSYTVFVSPSAAQPPDRHPTALSTSQLEDIHDGFQSGGMLASPVAISSRGLTTSRYRAQPAASSPCLLYTSPSPRD